MEFSFKHLLHKDFADDSRVWIYQSSRLFSLNEALAIEEMLNDFTGKWLSHGVPVKAAGYLFFGQFIVLMADERATGVSGCGTDSSVRLIKDIEQKFDVNLFDRTTLAFVVNENVQMLPISQVVYAFDNGFLKPDNIYFNNLVQTKEELENNWLTPISKSWLKRRFDLKIEH